MSRRRRTASRSRGSRLRRPRSPGRGTATVSRDRILVVAAAAELAVSLALLLFASLSPDELPAWGGPLDVAVAAALFVTAGWIWSRAMRRVDESSWRVAHIAAATVPALTLAAVWVFRDQLDLNVLLPGLAWRTFLVLYSLPSCLTAWRQPIRL